MPLAGSWTASPVPSEMWWSSTPPLAWSAGKADDLALGVELARASIDDGHAAESLTRLVDVSNA